MAIKWPTPFGPAKLPYRKPSEMQQPITMNKPFTSIPKPTEMQQSVTVNKPKIALKTFVKGKKTAKPFSQKTSVKAKGMKTGTKAKAKMGPSKPMGKGKGKAGRGKASKSWIT